jgi:hypothetical protein
VYWAQPWQIGLEKYGDAFDYGSAQLVLDSTAVVVEPALHPFENLLFQWVHRSKRENGLGFVFDSCFAKSFHQWLGIGSFIESRRLSGHKSKRFELGMCAERGVLVYHESLSDDEAFCFLNPGFEQFGIERAFIDIEEGDVVVGDLVELDDEFDEVM